MLVFLFTVFWIVMGSIMVLFSEAVSRHLDEAEWLHDKVQWLHDDCQRILDEAQRLRNGGECGLQTL